MNIYRVIIVLVCMVTKLSSVTSLNLANAKQEKMSLAVGIIQPQRELQEFADYLVSDLACCDQQKNGFKVHIKSFAAIPTKKQIEELSAHGIHLLVLLDMLGPVNTVQWRLYDTFSVAMLGSGRCLLHTPYAAVADMLADRLWQLLVGSEGVFSTRLVFCKERQEGKHILKDVVVSSPFRYDPVSLVQGGKLLAPRWHSDPQHPMVMYSEVTPHNVRLMSVDMKGQRLVISNNEGLTMLPSFAHDGSAIVYCATVDGYSQLFEYRIDQGKGMRTAQKITDYAGHSTSPIVCPNGDLLFCSDYKTKAPQIFLKHKNTGTIEQLTPGGHCACPAYCEKTKKLAYIKIIDHVAQVLVYDYQTRKHTQLTFDRANKDECCWSPCGTYLAFVTRSREESRISIMNIPTGERWFLSPPGQRCSFPSWSLKYAGMPPCPQKNMNYSVSGLYS